MTWLTHADAGVFSYLPVDVLLQTDGAVRRGAAAQWIRGSTAALALAFSFGLELARLHLLQSLDGHSVHGALQWGGRWRTEARSAGASTHVMIKKTHGKKKQTSEPKQATEMRQCLCLNSWSLLTWQRCRFPLTQLHDFAMFDCTGNFLWLQVFGLLSSLICFRAALKMLLIKKKMVDTYRTTYWD